MKKGDLSNDVTSINGSARVGNFSAENLAIERKQTVD